jgi:Uma2 family endonuclease
MATVASAPPEIDYPSSDGEPMAETPIHRDVMLDQIVTLKAHFADEPNVYVSGNMMMYYVEGNADKVVSPDVFVTRGIPKRPERDVYKLWVEGKGPDAVIEVTSKSTARVDQRRKFDLYRDVLKVQEYFMFDPREKTLAGVSLCGYRLIDGEYELIPMTDGRLASKVLGLHLEASGDQLRLYDPDRGVYLPTPAEIREAAAREAAEAQAAREAAAREAAAREAAEAQAAREAAAREAVARASAEAEVERLRREIEALRRASGPSST